MTDPKPKKERPEEHRNYCFTWNNYTDENITSLKNYKYIRYCIFGKEKAPTTGTPHLQGYMQLNAAKSFSAIEKYLKGISLRVQSENATLEDNRKYCSKEGDFEEWGTPSRQGKRNDITAAMEAIEDGASELELFQTHGITAVKYDRGLSKYRMLLDKVKCRGYKKRQVFVIYGKTDRQKTRRAYDFDECAFRVTEGVTGFWWTGYDGEKTVIFDDFRGNIPLSMLLQLLDGYGVQVSVHNGLRFLMATTIFITSNTSPWDWYPNCDVESKKALMRRYSKITYCTTDYANQPQDIEFENPKWEDNPSPIIFN